MHTIRLMPADGVKLPPHTKPLVNGMAYFVGWRTDKDWEPIYACADLHHAAWLVNTLNGGEAVADATNWVEVIKPAATHKGNPSVPDRD